MSKNVIIDKNGTVAYIVGKQAAVNLNSTSYKKTKPKKKDLGGGSTIATWGDDNLFPQNVKREVTKSKASTIIPTTLKKKADLLVAGGISYGLTKNPATGEKMLQPTYNQEIEDFLARSLISERYLPEAALDYYWYKSKFPMMVQSRDRKKITRLIRQAAPNCRWEMQDDNGLIRNCYINANWAEGANVDDKETVKLPVIDLWTDDDPVEVLKAAGGTGKNYIYPCNSPFSDEPYYPLAEWDTARTSGWLDVAYSIPYFKKQLMANQVTIRYHIEIYDWYWEQKYKDWGKKSQEERIKIYENELDAFEDKMSGEKNAGNSIMSFVRYNAQTRQEERAFKITPMDDKIQNGVYIEDSKEASNHIYYALGADPTLFGSVPGGKSEGSGSDKRTAYNIYMITTKPDQDKLLEPLNFIARYNGWPERFWFTNYMIATYDKENPENRI